MTFVRVIDPRKVTNPNATFSTAAAIRTGVRIAGASTLYTDECTHHED
jgi:hypothetical protein